MIINKWMGTTVEQIEGLAQDVRLMNDWPYQPDWIVERLSLDTGNRCYWIHGHHANGKPFFWSSYLNPLSWRYDLNNATFEIGRHETRDEAFKREFAHC